MTTDHKSPKDPVGEKLADQHVRDIPDDGYVVTVAEVEQGFLAGRATLLPLAKRALVTMRRQMKSDDSCGNPFNEDMAECIAELKEVIGE